jgi:hypothetical protein
MGTVIQTRSTRTGWTFPYSSLYRGIGAPHPPRSVSHTANVSLVALSYVTVDFLAPHWAQKSLCRCIAHTLPDSLSRHRMHAFDTWSYSNPSRIPLCQSRLCSWPRTFQRNPSSLAVREIILSFTLFFSSSCSTFDLSRSNSFVCSVVIADTF